MSSPAPSPSDLCRDLAQAPHSLDPACAQRLLDYAEALAAHTTTSLTALRDMARVVNVLLRPSLLFAWAVQKAPSRIADVGTGNGFPGIAAAAIWPDAEVLLVERRARKADAVRVLAAEAGFSNVQVRGCDAREVSREAPGWKGACDLVILRAVGPLAATTRLTAPLLAPTGCLAHAKSAELTAEERDEGLRVARTLGLHALDDIMQPHLATGRVVRYARVRA